MPLDAPPDAFPDVHPAVPSHPPVELHFPAASAAHNGSGRSRPADSVSRQLPRRLWAKMAAGSGPGARELFAEGLLQFLRPAVRQLDRHVHSVRSGQSERPGAGQDGLGAGRGAAGRG